MTDQTTEHQILDVPTLVALSAVAYVLATLLHEVAGHGMACVALGGRVLEIGAFYVTCDYRQMPDLAIRAVAFAGPLLSLLTGTVAFLILPRLPQRGLHARYFAWLLGTLGLLVATGYLLFSGITGLGDFGTSRDGLLYRLAPEWLWRVVAALAGAGAYLATVLAAVRRMERLLGGAGPSRIRYAQKLAITSYLTGGAVSVLIGLLNPVGVIIVPTSAAAASLGGTSGLLWMMQTMSRKGPPQAPRLLLDRNWAWICAGLLLTVIYAVVFGPTIRP